MIDVTTANDLWSNFLAAWPPEYAALADELETIVREGLRLPCGLTNRGAA